MATKTTHAEALKALDKIEKILAAPSARGFAATDLCSTYAKIKPLLQTALTLVKLIPIYGSKIAAAIEFLMSIADKFCPAA